MADDKAPPAKAKKIISPTTNCADGTHTFIVTFWQVTGSARKAMHMMCRNCLMPIELNEASKDWVVNREWLKEKSGGTI